MKTQKKRKIERKTNYSKRMKLLKSELPRIVVRKTNKYIVTQYIESHEAKDKVISNTSSRELLKHGWPEKNKGSLKSIPAAYLTGLLAGKKIIKVHKGKIILDIGMHRGIKGNRLFATLGGLVESGLNISHDKKAFPNKERLEGKHLDDKVQKEIDKIKQNIIKK